MNSRKLVNEMVLADPRLKNLKINELERGDRPSGEAIGEYRSVSYEMMKQRMNPKAGGDVDLILTGSFSSQMKQIQAGERSYIFESKDEKSGMLQERYGSDIMGLSQKTFDGVQKDVYAPQLISKIKQITGL